MHEKLSANKLGTLMLGFNSASLVLDFPYVAVTSVLTVTDDYIHSHRLYLSHLITMIRILSAVRLGFWLCQFKVGVGVLVRLGVVLFVIVSVCSTAAQPTQRALNQK